MKDETQTATSTKQTPEDAKAVARKLLPDILSYHPLEPARFPQNG